MCKEMKRSWADTEMLVKSDKIEVICCSFLNATLGSKHSGQFGVQQPALRLLLLSVMEVEDAGRQARFVGNC